MGYILKLRAPKESLSAMWLKWAGRKSWKFGSNHVLPASLLQLRASKTKARERESVREMADSCTGRHEPEQRAGAAKCCTTERWRSGALNGIGISGAPWNKLYVCCLIDYFLFLKVRPEFFHAIFPFALTGSVTDMERVTLLYHLLPCSRSCCFLPLARNYKLRFFSVLFHFVMHFSIWFF